MNGPEALENIKSIKLSHVEHDQDEDINGEWVYTDNEVYDGTVAENYPEEIEILEKERKALEIIKKKGLHHIEVDLLNIGDYEYYKQEMSTMVGTYDPNSMIDLIGGRLKTEDEFNLLKEAMK